MLEGVSRRIFALNAFSFCIATTMSVHGRRFTIQEGHPLPLRNSLGHFHGPTQSPAMQCTKVTLVRFISVPRRFLYQNLKVSTTVAEVCALQERLLYGEQLNTASEVFLAEVQFHPSNYKSHGRATILKSFICLMKTENVTFQKGEYEISTLQHLNHRYKPILSTRKPYGSTVSN